MNAQSTAVVRAPLQSGGQVAAIIPQTIEDAFRVANAFSASGLAPQSLKGPEAILVSIMAGAELGFAPYQAMQSFAVINGRASIWGDAIPALLWSRGFDIEETFDDEDNPTKAICVVTRPSGKEIRRTFSLGDAKDANLLGKTGPWQTARKRMLQMRARAFAARDGASDVLRGMPVYEEVADFTEIVRDVTPKMTGMRARLEARTAAAEGFDPAHVARETGAETAQHDADGVVDETITDAEILDEAESFPGDCQKDEPPKPSLIDRIANLKAAVEGQETLAGMAKAWSLSGALRTDIDAGDPDEVGTSAELEAWFNETYAAREEAEKAKAAEVVRG